MKHYERKVFFSKEDGGWIATAPELRGCSAFGDKPEAALKELETAIELWLEIAKEDGKAAPQPIADQEMQGKILLRVPKTLQRDLKQDAAAEGVSVNQYALFLLSSARAQVHTEPPIKRQRLLSSLHKKRTRIPA